MAIAKPGYVYLVRFGPYYKIGRSVNPEGRVKAFTSVKMPYPFEIIHTIESSRPVQAEAHLHHRFSKFRMDGEWFKLPGWAIEYFKHIRSIESTLQPASLTTQCATCGIYEMRTEHSDYRILGDGTYGDDYDQNAIILDFADAVGSPITGMKGW